MTKKTTIRLKEMSFKDNTMQFWTYQNNGKIQFFYKNTHECIHSCGIPSRMVNKIGK